MVGVFSCPYCCDSLFNSKESLIKHLSRYINVLCPICRCDFKDVTSLIKHLYSCNSKVEEAQSSAEDGLSYDSSYSLNNPENEDIAPELESNNVTIKHTEEIENNLDPFITLEPPKDFLKTEATDTSVTIPQLTIIHENGVKKYVIVNREVSCLNNDKIIKQNPDGTISLTNMKDFSYEEDTNGDNISDHDDIEDTEAFSGTEANNPNSPDEPESTPMAVYNEKGDKQYVFVKNDSELMMIGNEQSEEATIPLTVEDRENNYFEEGAITASNMVQDSTGEDLYSCNTCKISFTSVSSHIQTFHSDQDVVVEINDDATINNENVKMEIEEDVSATEVPPTVKNGSILKSRVIGKTGKIIETLTKPTNKIINNKRDRVTMAMVRENTFREDELFDSVGRKYIRKMVKVGKLWSAIKQADKEVFAIPINDDPEVYHHGIENTFESIEGDAKIYQCIACNIYVKHLEDFRIRPCNIVVYKCNICEAKYDNGKSLSAHMKAHKSIKPKSELGENKNNLCKECGTEFPTNKSLKLHVRMHDPVKSRILEPPVDGTTNSDTFLCGICKRNIPSSYRTVHEEYHSSTSNFHCQICNREFQSKEYLDMHKSVHIDKTPAPSTKKKLPYTCMYCPKQFTRPHEKVKHERIHTGEKPHTCEICGKSFRVSYCLTLHMRTHTGDRPYECVHCKKRFKAHSVYTHHLMTHSDVRAYKCPYCPKSFKTSVHLAGHKNSHTKPFSCNICNRPFASLYAVRVHTETHQVQNNLKYSCTVCGAIYARTFALKDHIRQAHPEKADEKLESMIETDGEVLDDTSKPLAERLKIKVPKILNTFMVKQD